MEFMNRKMFKLSVVSSAILATTQVSAALYNVVEVTPNTSFSYKSSYGVAIEPTTTTGASDNCFVSSVAGSKSCDSYILGGETRSVEMNSGEAVDGLSYREEVPFAMNNEFDYIQTRSDFQNYCEAELRYSTCNAWASPRWSTWSSEKSSSIPNSIAFIGSGTTGTVIDSTETLNVVINSISSTGTPIGVDLEPANVSANVRNSVEARGEGASPTDSYDQSRAWAANDDYTVGSTSKNYGSYYRSKAAIWNNSDGTTVQIPWDDSATSSSTSYYAQGSIRDFAVDTDSGYIYAVGYNSYNSTYNYMNATVFKAPVGFTSSSDWTSILVSNTQAKIDGTRVHSNSVVTSINSNLVAIGSAKRYGYNPKNGAAANRLFIIPDVSASTSSLTAVFPSVGIIFSGAGGRAGAINNYNEIVGQIDFENSREVDGKPRRKRAFIYPYVSGNYNGTDTDEYEERAARFKNKPWFLDDLTNGDNAASTNNQYRVVDATDINDVGVISGTALKCSGGYSTTSHNASCSGTESVVAVKLVPIVGATSSDISQRSTDTTTSERSGGSLGLWSLILLALGWFRRK